MPWTDKTISKFSPSQLATCGDLVTEVESKLGRGDITEDSSPSLVSVKRWLTRAKEELASIKGFTFSYKFVSTVIEKGSYRALLPNDYNGGDLTLRNMVTHKLIKIMLMPMFNKRFPDIYKSHGSYPTHACVKNLELWIAPIPRYDTLLELEYDRSGSDEDPEDFSYIPEIERFRCADMAIAEAAESVDDWDKAKWYWAKWQQGLAISKLVDGKRKWKASGYSVNSLFGEGR